MLTLAVRGARTARALPLLARSISGSAPSLSRHPDYSQAHVRAALLNSLKLLSESSLGPRLRQLQASFGQHAASPRALQTLQKLKKLAACGGIVGASVDSVREMLGYRTVTPADCAASCDDLLRSVLHTPFTSSTVQGMYTLEFAAPHPHAPVLVLTHGYGSGSGMWLWALDLLAAHFKVYAVDWLGCGASARPAWSAKDVSQGEKFFTDSLESWRAAVGLHQPFVLAGHSLGGYLSASYALAYPQHIKALALVSPAGIPTPPAPEALARQRSHWLFSLLQWAWEANVTPQALVRAAGPWGQQWASNVLVRRFAHVLQEHDNAELRRRSSGSSSAEDTKVLNKQAFVNYLYNITVAEASGEYALNTLLAFGAHARDPMGPRLLQAATGGAGGGGAGGAGGATAGAGGAGGAGGASAQRGGTLRVPVTFLYGTYDWMPWGAGEEVSAGLRAAGLDAACVRVPDSGHHLYLEQPEAFAAALLGRLRHVLEETRGSRRAGR